MIGPYHGGIELRSSSAAVWVCIVGKVKDCKGVIRKLVTKKECEVAKMVET
jgi:hypothetical protein